MRIVVSEFTRVKLFNNLPNTRKRANYNPHKCVSTCFFSIYQKGWRAMYFTHFFYFVATLSVDSPPIYKYHPNSFCLIFFGAWLSLVERSVRGREAGGSNPLAPIKKQKAEEV